MPELALLALPVIVCVGFYYSARYRLVGAPLVCGFAALALVRWRALPWARPVALAVALAPLPLLTLNAVTGFESLDFMREPFATTLARHHLRAGEARETGGEPAAAAAYAGLVKAVDQQFVAANDQVVVLVTGSGLKDVASAMKAVKEPPTTVEPRLESVRQVIGKA